MNSIFFLLEQQLSPSEVVELLTYFLNFPDSSRDQLEEYAILNNICPKCFSKLTTYCWEERSEYFGRIVGEEMSELRCDCCGWMY